MTKNPWIGAGASLALLGMLLPRSMVQLRALGSAHDGGAARYAVHQHGGTRTQRHTGAGGAGMHRAWKKRRASGRR